MPRAKPSGGNSNPARQKQTKRNQRAIPLAGKKCAVGPTGCAGSLQRHESPPNSNHVILLCQKHHAALHVRMKTWAWQKAKKTRAAKKRLVKK